MSVRDFWPEAQRLVPRDVPRIAFPAIRIVADPSMPRDRAVLIASPSAEHRLAMEGMSIAEQARYMAGHRLAVAFKNIGEPEPPHALDEADRP